MWRPRTVRMYLQLMGARHVPTQYVLRHRQDRETAAEAWLVRGLPGRYASSQGDALHPPS